MNVKATSYPCDTEGHHWVWTRPIESALDYWVGTCSICRRVTIDDRQMRVAVLNDRLARARAVLRSSWLGRVVWRIGRRWL
jgi:hypothetical protein